MANNGKPFEHRISLSLRALSGEGWPMRIEDGGGVGKNPQLADFFFFSNTGNVHAIECKHTGKKSFELRKIGYGDPLGQLARLRAFEHDAAGRYSYIALEMEGGCYMVPARDFARIAAACVNDGRASVPEDRLQGYRLQRDGGLYRLEFK